MSAIDLIGIDLGKHSFHLHAQDRPDRKVLPKKFSRPQILLFFSKLPGCTVAMNACAGSHRMGNSRPQPGLA